MTLTPIKAAPIKAAPIKAAPADGSANGSGAASPGATDPATAGDFLAAILQALAPGADPATDAGPAQTGPEAPASDPGALGLVVPPSLAAQLVPAVAAKNGAPGAAGAAGASGAAGAGGAAAGPANVAAGAAVVSTGPTGDIRMSGDANPTPADATAAVPAPEKGPEKGPGKGPAKGTDPAVPADGRGTDGFRATDRVDVGPAAPDPNAGTAAAATTPANTDADRPAADASTLPPPTATVSPTSTAPAVSHGESATTTHHVTSQVIPEVTRLVSRGDGTHRITLDLNPESLGEVRVVMTVRDGAVHVRFAAGHEAGRALLDGSAELNRLLGAAGASETRIVVRDLSTVPTAAPATGTADGTSTGGDPGLGPGGHPTQDQHAGTRAEHHATDGSETTTPGTRGRGTSSSRSNQPVTRARTAGVDVTM
jgi:hypothetical protein